MEIDDGTFVSRRTEHRVYTYTIQKAFVRVVIVLYLTFSTFFGDTHRDAFKNANGFRQ